jgi:hypothetical protein
MTEDLDRLPLAEADSLIRKEIEHHRAEMGRWRRARAHRVAAERAAGRSAPDIADVIGVHVTVVYELLREARSDPDRGQARQKDL